MNDPVPRFEFRTFAPCLGLTEQRMRAMAPCEEINESREIYLLGYDSMLDRNIKIRHGQLELKRILERRQDLERWQPAGQWRFPVEASTLRDRLWPRVALSQVDELPATLSAPDVLRLADRPDRPLYRANVRKRRFRFTLPDCRAELDQLLVNGAAIESVAIESEDPQAVLEARSALQLEDCENQSYPLMLSRILGLAPLPAAHDYG
ncbi:MAG: hypothetical protein PVJ83_03915 [Gammaproteobacteria bacterium]|jgi:hypothetical protein